MIPVSRCRSRETLLEDLKTAADAVGIDGASFKWKDQENVGVVGWKGVSFLDSTSEDETKRENLKKWMKFWSHLVKMGYELD